MAEETYTVFKSTRHFRLQPPEQRSTTVRATLPPTVLCHLLLFPRLLLAGLSSGKTGVWRLKGRHASEFIKHGEDRTHHFPAFFLEGHKGGVNCLMHLPDLLPQQPDSLVVVSGSADRSIRIWDVGSSDVSSVQTLVGHSGSVTSLVYHASLLLSGSTDGTLRVWAGGGSKTFLYPWYAPSQTISGFDGWVTALAVSRVSRMGEAGRIFASDSTGSVWQFVLLEEHGELRVERAARTRFNQLHNLRITHMTCIPEESVLFSLGFDGKMRATNTQTGAIRAHATPSSIATRASPKGSRFVGMDWMSKDGAKGLVLADSFGKVHLWDLQHETRIVKDLQRGAITSLTCGRPSRDEFIIGCDAGLEWWTISRETRYRQFSGHTGPIVSLVVVNNPMISEDAASPSEASLAGAMKGLAHLSSHIYSASVDNTCVRWTPALQSDVVVTASPSCSEISAVACSARYEAVVTGHEDGMLRVWRIDRLQHGVTSKPIAELKSTVHGHHNTVTAMTLMETHVGKEYVVSADYLGAILFWDIGRAVMEQQLDEPSAAVDDPRGRLNGDTEILCMALSRPLPGKQGVVQYLATGGNDPVINIHRVERIGDRTPVKRLVGHVEPVSCMVFDGNFLISASDDGFVRVWDALGGSPVREFSAHQSPIRDLLHVPDTPVVATCTHEGQITFWDYTGLRSRRQALHTITHPVQFACIAYVRPGGGVPPRLLAGTVAGTVLAFDVPTDLLADVVHAESEERQAFQRPTIEALRAGMLAGGRTAPNLDTLSISSEDEDEPMPVKVNRAVTFVI